MITGASILSLASSGTLAVVWGYLDPGAGSMALQVLLAGLLSCCFFLKSWYRQLRDAWSTRKRLVDEK